tara:strand:- start:1574 stop:1756 length:183 start_codon:yes stop_codon:yes gene_type:complete
VTIPKKDICPECGFNNLYGPLSDFWGIACPECGWFEEYKIKQGDFNDDKNGNGNDNRSFD